jgi:hypothetical protein
VRDQGIESGSQRLPFERCKVFISIRPCPAGLIAFDDKSPNSEGWKL